MSKYPVTNWGEKEKERIKWLITKLAICIDKYMNNVKCNKFYIKILI